MNRKLSCIWPALLALPALAQPAAIPGDPQVARYDGQMLVRVTIRELRDLMLLGQVAPETWSHTPGGVPAGSEGLGTLDYPMTQAELEVVRAAGMDAHVIIEDLQRGIDEENQRLAGRMADRVDAAMLLEKVIAGREDVIVDTGGSREKRGWYDDYKTIEQVRQMADALVEAYPHLARIETVGGSIEQREIYAIRLNAGGTPKPIIMLNSVQHAREWITVMTTMYIADQLLAGYGTEPSATSILDRYEIVIIPVVNPDGYSYAWTRDRFWRKNRRLNSTGNYGVDTNRNWGTAWGLGSGSSGSTGSETYRGVAAFSEPETAAMRDWSNANPQIVFQLDVHSYGQYLLYPWGYTAAPAPAVNALKHLSGGMRSAILNAGGVGYAPGQCYSILYPVSGGCLDWYYADQGALTISPELRGPGFNPSPTVILPTAREIYAAILWLGENFCRADIDYTGFLDTDDFDAFVRAFESGSTAADFDLSGFVDTDDFDAFVAAFERGC
ncbi:MAG TPA: M14 family zinc carboxypeptidase [Phycisphaerales bacterium]|nr:M14 family zinc carboxypeptidase [Phycisphaerales bacterium]